MLEWKPHPGPQTQVLETEGVFEMLYGGARGGGKTDAGIAWLLRPPHFGHPEYRALVLRRTYNDLCDWIDRAGRTYAWCDGKKVKDEFRFSNGAVFRTGYLKDSSSYTRYQGHEYQRILIEEAGQIPDLVSYELLLGSCRSTIEGLEPEVLLTANPGGIGHAWLKERFGCGKASGIAPNVPHMGKDGRLRMYIPATVDDNPTLKRLNPQYVSFLENMSEPYRSAWRYGDWDIYIGQAFNWTADNVILPQPVPENARIIQTFDYGFGKPSSVGWWWCTSNDMLIRIDEDYQCVPGQADMGLRLSDVEIAQRIIDREKQMGWKPYLRLCDPTCFNKRPDPQGGGQGESTATVFLRMGLKLMPGDPNRKLKFRQFAARVNSKTLLTFSTCKDFIRTVPNLPMDERLMDDVDTKAEDHCYDEACHAVMEVPMPDMALEDVKAHLPVADAEVRVSATRESYTGLGDMLRKRRAR